MEPIDKKKAMTIINPHIERIKRAIFTGVDFYLNGDSFKDRHRLSPRTDASIIHDLIIDEVENEFTGVNGTYCKTSSNLFMLIIDSAVVLRFKKFDDKLLGSGINTQQSLAFNLQDSAQLELDGMPAEGLLYVGYRLNELNTKLNDIHITNRYNNYNIWEWNITGEENEITKPIQLPTPYPSAGKVTPKRTVTPKRKDLDDGDTGE